MKANGYYNHPRFPMEAGCGLIEEDSIAFTSDSGKTAVISFPLEIFPKAIRNIIEALEEYENYNVDFTAASFLTVFAAAMGNTWSVRFMTGWVSRPIIYMVLVGSPSCGKTPPLQQAVTPLLKLDGEYDMIYCKEMETYRQWERIIRRVITVTPSTDQEGKATSIEIMFSQDAKLRIIQWKDAVNNKAYAETDSDAVRALCGKLETYLVRFCLVIQIMHGICEESGMDEIEPGTAELAIRLTEYFRNMESRIAPEIETGILDNRFTELLGNLRDSFTTADAVREALQLGISESSVKRFLRDGGRGFVKKKSHGCYRKI